mmetsp:Transcript_12578/g.20964  ORF Transcript_12578/g.20964 Transcript_12578/m.20964 type:complete len:191 (+) Transcript_12578:47-619(+)
MSYRLQVATVGAPSRHRYWSFVCCYTNRWTSSNASPYSILGIADKGAAAPYKDVKENFFKLALEHHPDRNGGGCSKHFLKVREAFESIKELPDGGCAVVDDVDAALWSDDSLSDWFFEETGQNLSFRMDSKTRKEVAEVANMAQGGLDKGGAWEMARMIAREERCSSSVENPKLVEQGENVATSRRRRKR